MYYLDTFFNHPLSAYFTTSSGPEFFSTGKKSGYAAQDWSAVGLVWGGLDRGFGHWSGHVFAAHRIRGYVVWLDVVLLRSNLAGQLLAGFNNFRDKRSFSRRNQF